jgi:DNA-binding response OmpR family regulator
MWEGLHRCRPDLVIVDVGMGLASAAAELCRMERLDHVPSIVLVSRQEQFLVGKYIAADDFILKPLDAAELRARIGLAISKARAQVATLTLGSVVVDFDLMRVTANGVGINVTHLELELLRYLAQRAGVVVSRTDLLRDVWGYSDDAQTRSVDFAILRLRRKVEPSPHDPQFIRTVRGTGYCLSVSATAD